jgi:hypothetical protein
MTSVIFNDPSGSDFLYKFSGVQLNAPSGEPLALGANAKTADNSNAIVTVGESYIRIPQGVSNERPTIPDSYVGMMRYLTTENLLEYFNGQTNTWIPISLPAPSISSISPNYISFDASGTEKNTNTYTLTGSNFNNAPGGISVEVIGNNGAGTILLPDSNSASSETSATFTFDPSGTEQLIGISNELPFAVKLTNTNSGFSSTLNNAIIATNAGPEFTQPSVFTPSSFQTFAVQDPCANFIVGGIDLSLPAHYPLTFNFVSGTAGGFNVGGENITQNGPLTDSSFSTVKVPAGNRLSATASSYNFTMSVRDASSAISDANYTLSLANPTITSINPTIVNKVYLPVDISINGDYFIRDTNIVLYNQTSGISAEFNDISYNSTTSLTINDLSSNTGVGVYDICVNNYISPYQFFSSQLSIWENATITGGTSSIGYTDVSGNGFTTLAPYSDGYTVYIITSGSGVTFDTPSIFPSKIDYLVVGGGGGGGAGDAGGSGGGGGGAGGYLTGSTDISAGTTYTLNVGAGGTGVAGANGNNGGTSSISGTGISLSAAGGGGGAENFVAGNSGASGGGGGLRNNFAGGTGNTPSTTPAQGYNGGNALFSNGGGTGRGGGGGGALAPGDNGNGSNYFNSSYFNVGQGGDGGSGKANNIAGSGLVYYAGGGGAGTYDREAGRGGLGGGGSGAGGGNTSSTFLGYGQDASANTGGGGGGSTTGTSTSAIAGGDGGSGIIVLRHLSFAPTYGQTSFLINGGSYSGTPISGTYTTYPGYNTGTNTTPGTATVTYVDANGANPVSYATGPYAAGYTIVTFLTTTPDSGYTWNGTSGTYRSTTSQVLYYANTTDFTFQGTSPFPAQVEYLIVAGGGTGAKGTGAETYGGGGGGGEVLYGVTGIAPGVNYDIKVGSGGVMDPNLSSGSPAVGGDTVWYNLTANGADSEALGMTVSGGQGGNGGTNTITSNNPAGTSGIGGTSGNGFFGGLNNANGNNGTNPAGGGGGAAGCGRPPSSTFSESGGQGIASQISGTNQGYGAGGGGGGDSGTNFNGGSSPAGVVIGGRGGGAGAPTLVPTAGVANTGSGGGGMRADDIGAGGGGGTGIIILKFPSYYGF